ncbi:hypothetical protein [Bradyrhizobium lablabi]|uniref:hypothetical protein n=1 Tax=Bradyrhizobium lablabi TaxID=722472 RepID=UPI001BA6996C|nr:hypothetical protein [Bradyrhizobium lablabi]MBR0692310.1 hypothetical protein [Bradyrhizobium lablabi]
MKRARGGAAPGISVFGGGKTGFEDKSELESSSRYVAARGGGSMTYGTITAVVITTLGMQISNDTVFIALDFSSYLQRLSSTR